MFFFYTWLSVLLLLKWLMIEILVSILLIITSNIVHEITFWRRRRSEGEGVLLWDAHTAHVSCSLDRKHKESERSRRSSWTSLARLMKHIVSWVWRLFCTLFTTGPLYNTQVNDPNILLLFFFKSVIVFFYISKVIQYVLRFCCIKTYKK